MVKYDICIIGAGVSGLYCALKLSELYPEYSICILEKYKYIGGRVSTFKTNVPKVGPVQWEAGAGRIHSSHHQLLDLLKQYNLDVLPISDQIDWMPQSDHSEKIEFSRYMNNLALDTLETKTLRNYTLKELLLDTIGPEVTKGLIERYEYRSEIDTQRADKAVEVLSHELGSHSGYFYVKDGFSALVHKMKIDLQAKGVKILREYVATDIKKRDGGYEVSVKNKHTVHCLNVFVALTRDAVAELPCFKDLPILKQVKMRPLVRIYAVFPKRSGEPMWFQGITKFVCPPPVRYVIPINPKTGVIMISYTDGKDAEYWMECIKKKGERDVQREVMQQITSLFPGKDIPTPLYFKIHVWSDGCSYWTPGDYDFNKASKESVRPLPDTMPGVYMCGESWAYNQAWVECAIDQAKHAVNTFSSR